MDEDEEEDAAEDEANNALLKDMVLQALSQAGGVQWLTERALENPVAFLNLVGKVMPMQNKGADEGPLQVSVTNYADDKSAA